MNNKRIGNEFKYSVAIRTRGYSEKLEQTLVSLWRQSIKPSEIVIVLPYGVDSWKVDGYDNVVRFAYGKKGMITQRKIGIIETKYDYLLLLDDDIVFESNKAIESLFLALFNYEATCVIPFSPDSIPHGFKRIIYRIFGIAIPTKGRDLIYLPSSGQYYPCKVDLSIPYFIEGGLGRCIAVKRKFLIEHDLYGDESLEDIPYPLREDGAFIFSIVLSGGKAIMIDAGSYKHLTEKIDPNRLFYSYEASIANNYLFWRKYVLPRYNYSFYSKVAFTWLLVGNVLLALLSSALYKNSAPIKGVFRGFRRVFDYSTKMSFTKI